MSRGTRTAAFSTLTSLDPVLSACADRGERGDRLPDPPDVSVETQIARIVATPRHEATGHRRVGPRWRPTAAPSRRLRPRYGAIGLVASAALAVIAGLLWVSPSAGEPIGQASGARIEVVHPVGAAAAPEAPAAPTPTASVR
jgi:hypothetical protein